MRTHRTQPHAAQDAAPCCPAGALVPSLPIKPAQDAEFLDELRRTLAKRGIAVTDDALLHGECARHQESSFLFFFFSVFLFFFLLQS